MLLLQEGYTLHASRLEIVLNSGDGGSWKHRCLLEGPISLSNGKYNEIIDQEEKAKMMRTMPGSLCLKRASVPHGLMGEASSSWFKGLGGYTWRSVALVTGPQEEERGLPGSWVVVRLGLQPGLSAGWVWPPPARLMGCNSSNERGAAALI